MFEMADIDKAIVSNSQALKTKYRINGLTAIKAAVDKLIAADAQRHIKSKLIFIDDTAAMTKLGGTPPVNPTDQRGAKKAVDAIVTSLAPDYVVLLDGPDGIPHIVLDNPVSNDLDDTVDSDLPYASDVGFSNQPSRYLKITRVVGSIPNVPNAKEPDKLIALIETSVKAKPRDISASPRRCGTTPRRSVSMPPSAITMPSTSLRWQRRHGRMAGSQG
jgi:hypothetical protein